MVPVAQFVTGGTSSKKQQIQRAAKIAGSYRRPMNSR